MNAYNRLTCCDIGRSTMTSRCHSSGCWLTLFHFLQTRWTARSWGTLKYLNTSSSDSSSSSLQSILICNYKSSGLLWILIKYNKSLATSSIDTWGTQSKYAVFRKTVQTSLEARSALYIHTYPMWNNGLVLHVTLLRYQRSCCNTSLPLLQCCQYPWVGLSRPQTV